MRALLDDARKILIRRGTAGKRNRFANLCDFRDKALKAVAHGKGIRRGKVRRERSEKTKWLLAEGEGRLSVSPAHYGKIESAVASSNTVFIAIEPSDLRHVVPREIVPDGAVVKIASFHTRAHADPSRAGGSKRQNREDVVFEIHRSPLFHFLFAMRTISAMNDGLKGGVMPRFAASSWRRRLANAMKDASVIASPFVPSQRAALSSSRNLRRDGPCDTCYRDRPGRPRNRPDRSSSRRNPNGPRWPANGHSPRRAGWPSDSRSRRKRTSLVSSHTRSRATSCCRAHRIRLHARDSRRDGV